MTREDKQLLLQDICARIPYGVIGSVTHYKENGDEKDLFGILSGINHRQEIRLTYLPDYTDEVGVYNEFDITFVKPVLRPMLSMTEEEDKELCDLLEELCVSTGYFPYYTDAVTVTFWLLEHHFDFLELIEKGLAISTEKFNPYKD